MKCEHCKLEGIECSFCHTQFEDDEFIFCSGNNGHFCSVNCICDSLNVINSKAIVENKSEIKSAFLHFEK